MSDISTYQHDINTFCAGYAHIDLNHPGTVINLAIMTPWDIPPKLIPELREDVMKAKYELVKQDSSDWLDYFCFFRNYEIILL